MSSFFWYVLHSHPNKEEALRQYVVSQDIEAYLPLLHAHPKKINARKYLPYFPGYLFIHVDSKIIEYSKFKWIPFSTGLIRYGDEPAIVADDVISSIYQFLKTVNSQKNDPKFKKGDEIFVQSGLFEGYEAIFDLQLSGTQRVKVLLKLINQGRGLLVELPISQIRKKSEMSISSISQKN